jgi:hypothetical protein
MTTTEYLINVAFVLLVFRQARERELDRRSVIVPLVLMSVIGSQYLHSIPTAGNDLVLIVLLAAFGLTLGVLGGVATQVRTVGGVALARVGWIAGGLLVLGIGARMAFAFAIGHGFEPAVRGFSVAHQIGAAAWPVALVLMALIEVGARITVVQARGRRLVASCGRSSRSIVCSWIRPRAGACWTRRLAPMSAFTGSGTCCGRSASR